MTSCVAGPLSTYETDLAWLDRLLEREILRLRAQYELSLDELRGLYISDRQVDELVRQATVSSDPVAALADEAARLRSLRPKESPLAALARRFELTPVEMDVLLLALAPELSLKYETLYAYLNNDITRKNATVDLAMRVLREHAPAQEVRAHLRAGSRLFSTGLLDPADAPGDQRSHLALGFTLAPIVAQFLLGLPVDDPRLPTGVQLTPHSEIATHNLSPSAARLVAGFALRHSPQSGVVLLYGDSGSEVVAAGGVYAALHRHALVAVPISAIVSDMAAWPGLHTRLRLLASLLPAVLVVFDDGDALPHEPRTIANYGRIARELASSAVPLVIGLPRHSPWAAAGELPFVELQLPESSAVDRSTAWRSALERLGVNADSQLTDEIGERFALSYPRILAAASTAVQLSRTSEGDGAGLRESLWHAARRHSSQSLSQLATRVVKPHRWEHLVLPDATLRQVRDVASAIQHRDRVFSRWRMAERTGRGTGLMVLFAGASGTGKTMTAAVIGNALGLELYRIDLAAVVSKYIGETEKNLDRIFEAARSSNAILLFDEAEALLGKRSEVKDAHDRYANIEVAYLLQKMEEHEGVVILATNLSKNLDQAFARRMHYVVEFPRPDAALRLRLWLGMFPPETPIESDIDFPFLAEQFETSGGEIQAVALDAAFLASANSTSIGMTHIVQAMARHNLKQGNPASASGFKNYYSMVRSG